MVERGMLEAVKDLKAEYMISSASAFYYLKSMQEYDRLRREVEGRFKELGASGVRVPVRELVHVVNKTERVFENYLDYCTALSEPENSRDGLGPKIEPFSFIRKKQNEEHAIIPDYILNYALFLAHYFSAHARLGHREQAFLKAFYLAFDSDIEYLSTPEGDAVKLASLLPEGTSSEDFTLKLIRCAFTREGMRLFERVRNYTDEEKESENDKYGEYIFSHLLAGVLYSISPDSLCWEEVSLLLRDSCGTDLTTRSWREKTRNSLWVERRVALNSVVEYYQRGRSPEEAVELAIKGKQQSIARREKIPYQSLFHIEKLFPIENIRYELLTIRKNRRWLEKVLSR